MDRDEAIWMLRELADNAAYDGSNPPRTLTLEERNKRVLQLLGWLLERTK